MKTLIALALLGMFLSSGVVANQNQTNLITSLSTTPEKVIHESVADNFDFFGIASYYNQVHTLIVKENGQSLPFDGAAITLAETDMLALIGRYKVLMINGGSISVSNESGDMPIINPEQIANIDSSAVTLIEKAALASTEPELYRQLAYSGLWGSFQWLAHTAEAVLVTLQNNLVSSWGVTIILFAVLVKLIMWPISKATHRWQNNADKTKAILAPKLAAIKSEYDGEEAHRLIMDAHKEQGVSAFYLLKPSLGLLVQIPILVAIFNALGEMPQLRGQSFLWINDLAYPDAIAQLPLAIPLLGSTFNLLPILMTVVAVLATMLSNIDKSRKLTLHLMAALFLILFYPFPSAMVLYWTTASALQIVEQKLAVEN